MAWNKVKIRLENGETADALAPVIVSASRATDIPAFYTDWFFSRLQKGYSAWMNPFNGVRSYVSYRDVRVIVFWSKNPAPLLPYLEELRRRGIHCYIQFTLNNYEGSGLEPHLPSLEERIATFRSLTDVLGKGKVIWRFDPLVLSDRMDVDDLLERVRVVGNQLHGYTDKLVFSYADISVYRKVAANLDREGFLYREFTEADMLCFAKGVHLLNEKWNYDVATCAEEISLEEDYDIYQNKCVDDDLMIRYFSEDKVLMEHLGVECIPGDLFHPEDIIRKTRDNKDKGQRLHCGCITSKDIGEYNTCPHLCAYCYANSSKEKALANWRCHQQNPYSETITGR
ncbi:DUF1848 domain-containing protein [Parabacteroides chinchillae]|uniref:DUF1848 domain-containing protein n=1 Tax=Parabacteroides chinchillae TaxID=871327 RepID=A0A8G2F3W2_9BACT|nr:DUF1848 domain-containing protein [Parabacteroides chinchillae]SEF45901.1 protein of unknown function [Parabacteroides chinchillae]